MTGDRPVRLPAETPGSPAAGWRGPVSASPADRLAPAHCSRPAQSSRPRRRLRDGWPPFQAGSGHPGEVLPGPEGTDIIRTGRPDDRSAAWLRAALAGLGALAAAAAVVSFTAQYRMVLGVKRVPVVAGLEAAIPDASALVFASLGIALALHGRRAIRARALNVASVAASVFMNAIAAAPGWRSLAIWALPPVAYALASDTLIGVVRAWAIARQRALDERLAGEEATPLAVVGGLLLWLLRLAVAPRSTLGGFRAWVVEECPVAPGRRLRVPAAPSRRAIAGPRSKNGPRSGSKTQRFLALVAERHGPLAGVPVGDVSRISTALAPEAGLNAGAARTALRKAVLAAQDGAAS